MADPQPEASPTRPPVGRSAVWLVAVTAVVVLMADQVAKMWAVARLEYQPPVELLGTWLRLVFVRNSGAAFSLGAGATLFVSLLALVIVGVLMYRARNLRSVWWALAMGGMIGGALGNLTDRVFRFPGGLQGHVVDFIAVPYWPIFNVADMAVVSSAVLMVILAMVGIDFDGTRTTKDSEQEAAGGQPSSAGAPL